MGCGVRVAVTTTSGDAEDCAKAVVEDANRKAAAERRRLSVDMETSFRPTGGKFKVARDAGRSPGSRVVASIRLPGDPALPEASGFDGSPLTAHSCGGSSGIERVKRSHRIPVSPSCEGTNVH
jgi:hypothetical protein